MFILTFLFTTSIFASELKFDSFSQVVFFLDTTASSCQEVLDAKLENREASQDIKSIFFQIPNPTLSYSSENSKSVFQIAEIHMELTSPKIVGESYVCSIQGAELAALFAKDANNRWSGMLESNTQLGTSNFCKALKCGGINLNTRGPVRIQTELKVLGQEIDETTGVKTPIEATKMITIYKTN